MTFTVWLDLIMLWPFLIYCSHDNDDDVFLLAYIIVYKTVLSKCK